MPYVPNNSQVSFGSVSVAWTINETSGTITFNVQGRVTGYISVCLSTSSTAHFRSSCATGWITSTGSFTLLDGWLTRRSSPENISPSKLTPISGTETGGVTSFSFSRPLNIGDAMHYDIPKDGRTIYMPIAYHSTRDGSGTSISQHTSMTVKEVIFYQLRASSPPPPPPAVTASSRILTESSSKVLSSSVVLPVSSDGNKQSTTVANGRIKISWSVNLQTRKITFEVHAVNRGWTSIGFSTSQSGHSNTESYTAWVDNVTMQPYIYEGLSSSKTQPSLLSSIVSEFTASQTADSTIFSFTRDISPPGRLSLTSTVYLSWAFSSFDGDSPTTFSAHDATDCGGFFAMLTSNANVAAPPTPITTTMFAAPTPKLTGSSVTVANGKINISWLLNRQANKITFTVTSKHLGWTSIGFSNSNSGHRNTESYTIWVDDLTKKAFIYEGTSSSRAMPKQLTAIASSVTASQTADSTVFTFTRDLSPGNRISLESQVYMSYAFSPFDGNSATSFGSHGASDCGILPVNFAIDTNEINAVGGEHNSIPLIQMLTGRGLEVVLLVFLILIVIALQRFVKYLRKKWLMQKSLEYNGRDALVLADRRRISSSTNLLNTENNEFSHRIPMQNLGKSSSVPPLQGHKTPTTPQLQSENQMIPLAVPKSSYSKRLISFRRMMGTRAPMTQSPYSSIGLFVLYIVICLSIVAFNTRDIGFINSGLDFGYVTSSTSLLVAMPAGRNSLIFLAIREPFERTLPLHRMLGRLMFVFAVIHGALVLKDYPSFSKTFEGEVNIFGYVSGFILLLIVLSSLSFIRKKYFNSFFFTHIGLFISLLVFSTLHAPKTQIIYTGLAIGLWVIDRMIRWYRGTQPQKVLFIQTLRGNALRIRFQRLKNVKYRVGQYVYINVPAISRTEWHPFSLCSGPHTDYCELTIKVTGDFTKQLCFLINDLKDGEHGEDERNIVIAVDGPYGKLNMAPERYDTLILAGGGIGITPLISILNFLYEIDINKAHPSKRSRAIEVFLIWVVPTVDEYSWFENLFERIQAKIANGNGEYPRLFMGIWFTKKNPDRKLKQYSDAKYSQGRPDMDSEVTRLMSAWYDLKQAQKQEDQLNIGAYCCGPKQMSNDFWEATNRFSRKKVRVDVDILSF